MSCSVVNELTTLPADGGTGLQAGRVREGLGSGLRHCPPIGIAVWMTGGQIPWGEGWLLGIIHFGFQMNSLGR